MTRKKISIITASITIPIVIFAVVFGATDFLKEDVESFEITKTPVYVPSDITKANPNFVVSSGGSSSYVPMTAENLLEHLDHIVEGTVTEIDDPVVYVLPNGEVRATIPVMLSVEKVHKGNVENDLPDIISLGVGARVFIDGYQTYSYSAIGKEAPSLMHSAFQDYSESEILNAENIIYQISHESAQFEVGDKVIVNLNEYTVEDAVDVVYLDDYDGNYSSKRYSMLYRNMDVIHIQDGVMFSSGGKTITEIVDSRGIPTIYVERFLSYEERQ